MFGWIILLGGPLGGLITYVLIKKYYPIEESQYSRAFTELSDLHPWAFFGMLIWPLVLPFVLMDKSARIRYKERRRVELEDAKAYHALKARCKERGMSKEQINEYMAGVIMSGGTYKEELTK